MVSDEDMKLTDKLIEVCKYYETSEAMSSLITATIFLLIDKGMTFKQANYFLISNLKNAYKDQKNKFK